MPAFQFESNLPVILLIIVIALVSLYFYLELKKVKLINEELEKKNESKRIGEKSNQLADKKTNQGTFLTCRSEGRARAQTYFFALQKSTKFSKHL